MAVGDTLRELWSDIWVRDVHGGGHDLHLLGSLDNSQELLNSSDPGVPLAETELVNVVGRTMRRDPRLEGKCDYSPGALFDNSCVPIGHETMNGYILPWETIQHS